MVAIHRRANRPPAAETWRRADHRPAARRRRLEDYVASVRRLRNRGGAGIRSVTGPFRIQPQPQAPSGAFLRSNGYRWEDVEGGSGPDSLAQVHAEVQKLSAKVVSLCKVLILNVHPGALPTLPIFAMCSASALSEPLKSLAFPGNSASILPLPEPPGACRYCVNLRQPASTKPPKVVNEVANACRVPLDVRWEARQAHAQVFHRFSTGRVSAVFEAVCVPVRL